MTWRAWRTCCADGSSLSSLWLARGAWLIQQEAPAARTSVELRKHVARDCEHAVRHLLITYVARVCRHIVILLNYGWLHSWLRASNCMRRAVAAGK